MARAGAALWAGCALGVVLGLGMAAEAQRVSAGGDDRAAALAAYDAGDTAKARAMLEGISRRYARDFAVQEALGVTEAEAGDTAAALPHLQAAADAQPRNAEALGNLGAAYLALEKLPDAVRTLRAATAIDGKNAVAEANLGRALFRNKEYKDAAASLGRASTLDPGNAALIYDRAVALDMGGQSAAAMALLAALPPERRTAAVEALWGDVAEHAGKYEDSVAHFEAAARMEPTEPHLFALCVELLRHWTWKAASEVANFGLSRYPESARLRLAKGVAMYGNTQYAEASAIFAGLLRAEPNNEMYGDLLGRSCSALAESLPSDCRSLTAFAEGHPANAQASIFAAISILHMPQTEQDLPLAERLLQQAIAHEPKSAEAHYQLGVLEQEQRRWPASEAELLEALRLRPGYAEAHYRLSRAYAHEGKAELAKREVELQQRYAEEEKATDEARLKEVTIFLTDSH